MPEHMRKVTKTIARGFLAPRPRVWITLPWTFKMRISTTVLCLAMLCLLASKVMVAEATEIYVWSVSMEADPQLRFVRNVVAYAEGSTDPIIPTWFDYLGAFSFPMFDFAEGTYQIVVDEPGYYRATETIVIDAESVSGYHYAMLVPISEGLTVLNHLNLNNPNQFFAYFTPNLTVPASAGFSVSHISPITGTSDYGPYNFGTPPASIMSNYWTIQLRAANAGIYRLYYNAYQLPEGFGYPPINFTMSQGVKVSIYAGTNPVTGHFATYSPELRGENNWYVGDIVVTNPSFGCSDYAFVPVNTYSDAYSFDQIDHGAGTFIAGQCVDTSPAALACTTPIFEPDVSTVTCGAFGDPHVIKFDGVGVTCGQESTITLLDNEHFSITASTVFLNNTNNATAIDSITLTYKGYCNPTSITFNNVADLESQPINSPYSFAYGLRISGNNAYIDALHLRLQVRYDGTAVLFGISVPQSLAEASTGICVSGCPAGTEIDESAALRKRDASEIKMAMDACTDAGLTTGTFEYNACLFDVSATSNTAYAADAASIGNIRAEVSTAWTPAPISGPSAPTGAASATLPSFLGLLLACFIATFLF